jgi:DNA polymerase III epsilon subunit-like protein
MQSNNFFQIIWALDHFLVLDTETTGLGSRDEIVQLAIVNKAGQVLFDSLIKPTCAISPGAAAVHGISNLMLEHAPTILDVHQQLHQLLDSQDIVVYNAPFDRPKLARTCLAREAGDLSTLGRWHDAMQPYAEHWGAWSNWHQSYTWQSLTNACAQQGIEVREDAHSAVADCLMTLALIEKLATAE